MADQIDALLRAADKGAPIGTTQRYFKASAPPAAPTPAAPPVAQPSAAPSGESEKETIDRILGRKRQSMSDVGEGVKAGDQFAMADAEAKPAAATERTYKLERDGKTVTIKSPRELSVQELSSLAGRSFKEVAAKAPVERGEGDKVTGPTTAEGIQGRVFGAGQPKPLDTVQRIGNAVLPAAATAPMIAAGGAALPAAPLIGEALVAGGLGGAKSASKGESPFWGAFVDALSSAGWGGALKLVPGLKIPFSGKPSLGDLQGRKEAYESVAPRIEQAFSAIKGRLPDTKWVRVPTLGSKKMTPKEAIDGLKKLEGTDFKQARQEIVAEFEKKVTHAGNAMDLRAPAERFKPSGGFQRAAETVVPAARGQTTAGRALRAGVEAEATGQDIGGPTGHLPIGVLPALAAREGAHGFGDIARSVTRLAR